LRTLRNPQPQPQALVAFADKGQFTGETNEKERNQAAGRGMSAFLAACVAIIAIGAISYFALSALQQPTGLAYAADDVRIDPSWIERSTKP
jgi:hypothetical protein